ncbi:carboxypeptidase-like regulatory domain-containing protein [Mucilaginibacter sp.]
MRFVRLILFLFFPLISFAQNGIVTGKVTRADNKQPIPLANVFLSNSTAGTATASDGTFILNHLKPGQYTLVVSILGYEDYSTTVLIGDKPINLPIELSLKITELHEVIVTTPANWKINYAQFVKEFIGTDDNAKLCYVVNPKIVNLIYHKTKEELEGYTDDFLVVDNMALGYRVKFLINEFTSSKLTGIISTSGQRLFQELPGTKKQMEEWKKKRQEAYYGSAMHFYRSLYTGKLDSDGFIVMKLTQLHNVDRPQENIIQQKIKKYNDGFHRDSVKHWLDMENLPKYMRQHLSRDPLPVSSYLFATGQKGIYAVNFNDYLYVVYTKKHETSDFKDLYRPLDMETYETSVLSITKPYLFDTNGVVFGESAPLYEGTWSKSRLSDLLPVDYTPGD